MISRYFSNDLAQEGYVARPSSLVANIGIFLLIDILGFVGGGGSIDIVLVLAGRLDPSVSLIYIKPGSGLFYLGRRG